MASQLNPNDIAALNTLPDAEKADFQRWLVQENTKMELQDRIHTLTDKCFRKCVPSTASQDLSSSEKTCVQNCASTFMEMGKLTVKQLEKLQRQG